VTTYCDKCGTSMGRPLRIGDRYQYKCKCGNLVIKDRNKKSPGRPTKPSLAWKVEHPDGFSIPVHADTRGQAVSKCLPYMDDLDFIEIKATRYPEFDDKKITIKDLMEDGWRFECCEEWSLEDMEERGIVAEFNDEGSFLCPTCKYPISVDGWKP